MNTGGAGGAGDGGAGGGDVEGARGVASSEIGLGGTLGRANEVEGDNVNALGPVGSFRPLLVISMLLPFGPVGGVGRTRKAFGACACPLTKGLVGVRAPTDLPALYPPWEL